MCSLLWRGRWASVWILLCALTRATGSLYFHINAPNQHTVFQGDLKVTFNTSAGIVVQVQLVSSSNNKTEDLFPLPGGEGEFSIACTALKHAGIYHVRILNITNSRILSQTKAIHVKWPDISLVLPDTHEAELGEVTVKISVPKATCDNEKKGIFSLDLVYYGTNESGQGLEMPGKILEKEDVIEVTKMTAKRYECSLFDKAGLYKVLLMSSYDKQPVAESNTLVAHWSPSYRLKVYSETIYPCSDVFTVEYSHPPCIGDNDKIRLLARTKLTDSIAAPTHLQYVTEMRVKKQSTIPSVHFDCSLFKKDILVYCFKYVSTARDGSVSERHEICLPTEKNAGPVVDGQWGEWTSWGTCSASLTCGQGTRVRFHHCDSPRPSVGGAYCQGPPTQYKNCHVPCTDQITMGPLSPVTMSAECSCGCVLDAAKGYIAPASWCKHSSVWIVETAKGQIIKVNFQAFNLDTKTQWIKVWDGDSRKSPVLLHTWTGSQAPNSFDSSGHQIYVEYMNDGAVNTYNHQSTGFLMRYETQVANASVVVTPDDGAAIWSGTIVIVGATFCGLLCLAFVIFVIHQRFKRQKLPEKDLPGNESLLINGEIPNSPSHSSNMQGVQTPGSANISYTDISPTKREQMIAKGVSTHPGGARILAERMKDGQGYEGRQVAFGDPTSRRSSNSSTGCSCGSPTHQIPEGGVPRDSGNGKAQDGKHSSHTHKHKHHRRRHSPDSPTKGTHKARSPTRRSPGVHAPKATMDDDLSPTSPLGSPSKSKPTPMDTIEEYIPMDAYGQHKHSRRKHYKDTAIDNGQPPPGERLPGEGADAKRRSRGSPDRNRTKGSHLPATPDRQNANYIPQSEHKGKPPGSLPLRNVQRPDGKSPESVTIDANANPPTPSSIASSLFTLSPSKKAGGSIPPSGTVSPTEDGFEYDDIPDIPGSFLTMDHNAYTLTWSGKPTWKPEKDPAADPSEVSVEIHHRPPNQGSTA